MKQDAASLEVALADAIGDDPQLFAELRTVFIESATRHGLTLATAGGEGEWRDAAWRLKGAAASFAATALMDAAERAATARVRDPAALAGVAAALDELLG